MSAALYEYIPSELSTAGVKRGVSSFPVRSLFARRSISARPAEGRPGPSYDNADDEEGRVSSHGFTIWRPVGGEQSGLTQFPMLDSLSSPP